MFKSERAARRVWFCLSCTVLCWLAAGCSSSKSAPPTGFHFVTPTSSPTLDPAESLSMTVSESASWTLQSGCGNLKPAGTFSGGALTASGSTATYVAPQAFGPCSQDVVTATASTNSAALAVFLSGSLPSFTSTNIFTYSLIGGATPPGCAQGQTTCCPSSGTVIFPTSSQVNGVAQGALQVGAFSILGGNPLSATGGVPPYSWQLKSGSLPPGLMLTPGSNSSLISVTGTPTTPGCSTFTIELSDATAQANCDPTQANAPCAQASFNVVVVPAGVKVQVPPYPNAFSDAQNGSQGAPYPPTALVGAGGQAPYFWCQSPPEGAAAGGSTLPPGLQLNSIQQPNFDCPVSGAPSTLSTAGSVVISGTPANGADLGNNPCNGNPQPGCYFTQFKVYDSQLPYPAVSLVTLGNMSDVPLLPCSKANQAPNLAGGVLNPDSFLQQGPMVFLLRGFDGNKSAVVIAGSVVLDGSGNVTGGTVDVTRSGGHQQLTVQKGGSSYVVGTLSFGQAQVGVAPAVTDYSRGCMTLSLADANTGVPAPSASFSFTLGGCSNHFTENQITSTSDVACGVNNNNQPLGFFTRGHIIEFDDNTGKGTRATGIMRLQDSTSFSSGLTGPYAFGMSGGDLAKQHYAIAGSFTASSGMLTSVAADFDDGGTLGSQLTGGSGSYSAADANGRITGSMSVGQATFEVAGYVVSKNEVLLATTDTLSSSHPIIGGEAITTSTTFSTASLQNSHIFHIGGLTPTGPDVSVGVLNFDGVGSISGTIFEDQAATLATTAVSAVYQVDANTGRAPLSAPLQGQSIGAHPLVAYVIPAPANLTRSDCSVPANCVTGFLVGTDSSAQSGVLEFQTSITQPPPPFENLFVAGNYAYGTDESLDAVSPNAEGDVFASPAASSTTGGTLGSGSGKPPFLQDVDYGDTSYYCLPSSRCYLLQPSQALSGSYSVNPNGTGSFGGGVVSVTNGSVIFFIDESPANKHPSVSVAEQ